eukprot:161291_1
MDGSKRIRLFGVPLSPWQRIVAHTALLLGDEVEEQTLMPGTPDIEKPEIAQRNPFKQIPIADVDGTSIFDSGAIARYLAVNTPLYPTSYPLEMAKVDMALGSASTVYSKVSPLFYKLIVGPKFHNATMPTEEEQKELTQTADESLGKIESSRLFDGTEG